MNKKGWTARDYIIGLIFVSAIIAFTYLAVGSLATEYDTPGIVDENFNSHYNKLNDNTEAVSKMLDASSSSNGLSILGTADILISSTFSIINLIFGSLGTLKDQVFHIGDDFNIPSSVTVLLLTVLLSVITVSIIFIIINAVNKTSKL